ERAMGSETVTTGDKGSTGSGTGTGSATIGNKESTSSVTIGRKKDPVPVKVGNKPIVARSATPTSTKPPTATGGTSLSSLITQLRMPGPEGDLPVLLPWFTRDVRALVVLPSAQPQSDFWSKKDHEAQNRFEEARDLILSRRAFSAHLAGVALRDLVAGYA